MIEVGKTYRSKAYKHQTYRLIGIGTNSAGIELVFYEFYVNGKLSLRKPYLIHRLTSFLNWIDTTNPLV